MKILLWPTFSLPLIGGLEVQVHSLAVQFQKMGHQVLVISDHLNFHEPEEFCIDGISIRKFPLHTALAKKDIRQVQKNITELRSLCAQFQPDILNVHGFSEGLAFYQLRTHDKLSCPLFITIHGLIESTGYHTPACAEIWSRAKAISGVSRPLVESMEGLNLIHPNIHIISNGLPIPSGPRLPIPLDPPNLLIVGRVTEEKRFHLALHALKALLPKYPSLTLQLVGDGPLFNSLVELRDRLQLQSSVRFARYVDPSRVRPYYEQATLVLVPSRYESFSLVALEAALLGRPVIASDVMGLKEVIAHEESGLLIPPEDPAPIAAAIDTLLSDPQTLVQMGKAAASRAARLFSIEETAKKYLKMYEAAC